jgi:RNA polymerase sigma-70 factor (sigma-E family)
VVPSETPTATGGGDLDVRPVPQVIRFEDYVRARSASLVRAAYLLTGDRHLAEDLAQTALARVSVRWEAVVRRGDPDAYVRKTMLRTAIGWHRRRWVGERPTWPLPDVALGDPTVAVDAKERLRVALLSLTARQRAVVVLRFYEDRSEAEVARTLGCSIGAVKSQTAKGLAKLRRCGALSNSREGVSHGH